MPGECVPTSHAHAIEQRYGPVDGKDWRERKVRHIDADITANADGIFVAEEAVAGVERQVHYVMSLNANRGRRIE